MIAGRSSRMILISRSRPLLKSRRSPSSPVPPPAPPRHFRPPATLVSSPPGPAATQFAGEPGFIEHAGTDETVKRQKVRVSQISALANDLALALSASTLRIAAPVPGHAYVGIDVPHR